ncbi:MAG TPA: hypothetical protein VNO50_18285 [Pyrinomonadaceae bacterium]|nr:hypothetical protein [Pyrinomonadaceae bacterium]
MKKLLLILCVGLAAAACGSKSTVEIIFDGQAIPFETKSAWITTQDAIYGSSVPGEQKHALRWITLRNYDYQVKGALQANEGLLTSPEQVKLFLSLHDDPGTNKDTPVKVATFNGAKKGPMQFEFLNLTIFKDGKEQSFRVSLSGQGSSQDSEVKILSVTDDTITGEIDANVKTDGKVLTIKGPFTAKIFKS